MTRFLLMFAMFWAASVVHSQDDRFAPEIDGVHMDRTGYSMIWNEELNIPKLVCYELKLEELGGSSCAVARYHADPNLDEYAAAAYEGAFDLGYEKGHLLPNRHGRWSEDACEHTSYYSNILPQKTSLNRGPWDQLDDRVERLISKLGTVYVHAGPVPISVDTLPSGMPVPCGFWKVLLYEEDRSWKKEVYLFSQKAQLGENDNSLARFKCADETVLELLLGHSVFNHSLISPRMSSDDMNKISQQAYISPGIEMTGIEMHLDKTWFFSSWGPYDFFSAIRTCSPWCSAQAVSSLRVEGLQLMGRLLNKMSLSKISETEGSVASVDLAEGAIQCFLASISELDPRPKQLGEESIQARNRQTAANLYAQAMVVALQLEDCDRAVKFAQQSLDMNPYAAGESCERVKRECQE